jgi:ABC-type phosphate transport system, permease component
LTISNGRGAALGLSRWETVTRVILPAAVPSILTGVILSAGRVLGKPLR